MTQLPDVEDVIWSGGGAKTAEWPQVGAWVGGHVQSRPKSYHAKEYIPNQPGAGKPKFTMSGEPVIGIKVDVLTGQRDPADGKDDGVRRMHLEKWRQIEAVRHALMEAGVRHIEPGGELWVQWTGEAADGQSAQPAKTWVARYRPPANSTARITDMTGEAPRQAAAQAAQVAPIAQLQYHSGAQTVMPEGAYAPMAAQPAAPQAMPPAAPASAPQAPQGPAWGAQAPATPAPPPAPTAQAPNGHGQNVLTESVAAVLRSQGIDTSAFTIVPG